MPTKLKYLVFFFITLFIVVTGCLLTYNIYSIKYYKSAIKEKEYARPKNKNSKNNIIKGLLPQNKEEPIKLLFFGDMMLDRHVGEKIREKTLDDILGSLTSTSSEVILSEYDIVCVNLEGTVTTDGAHYPPDMSYDFAFSPEVVDRLKKYHFNYFNLANNHFTDQGERGIIETRENLFGMGFNFFGCQYELIGNCSYKIAEIKNKRIGLVGFSMVYGELNEERAKKIISQVASSSDYLVVNIHWGQEYEHDFSTTQARVAHYLIDYGADAIIGHHPHVAQGIEIYKDKPIFYSLGNFIFDQYFSKDTQEGLAVGIELEEESIHIDLAPFESNFSRVKFMDDKNKGIFLNNLIEWSNVERDFEKSILEGNFSLPNPKS